MHLAGNKALLEYDDTWKSLVENYEECEYFVDPSNFPSRAAKAAARRMPQLEWPKPRHKKAGSVSDEGEETEEHTVEQVTHDPEGKLQHFQTPTKSLKVPVELTAAEQFSKPA